ncbi:Bax inhibitor-1/YccA family protein [Saccharothrix australiensis]|uniref:Putative YccA/Bax inhibitor family protein n=1 Tax=Saccharothrix australiensis TaxID=2072 RepID=A0A495W262_9PSEU|nr:Bax inhibitor-1/YccA family protein [Saccharothrix australiensis]RKT55559.1 putative YccA/Bax inhibitor family protein [Saccharothrix australiensis]
MRTTTNPPIRSLLTPAPTASAKPRKRPPTRHPAYRQIGRGRGLTTDDVVTKTAFVLGATVASAVVTLQVRTWVPVAVALPLALGLAVYLTFRPRDSAVLAVLYAVAQGVVLGTMTRVSEAVAPGVAGQAVIATTSVFVIMLAVYKLRLVRLTTRRVKWLIVVLVGFLLTVLVDVMLGLVVGVDLGVRHIGFMGILFCLLSICLAAFSFLLSFDAADRMIRDGVPASWAWYLAFGLVMTLIWLYTELLWLLTTARV